MIHFGEHSLDFNTALSIYRFEDDTSLGWIWRACVDHLSYFESILLVVGFGFKFKLTFVGLTYRVDHLSTCTSLSL